MPLTRNQAYPTLIYQSICNNLQIIIFSFYLFVLCLYKISTKNAGILSKKNLFAQFAKCQRHAICRRSNIDLLVIYKAHVFLLPMLSAGSRTSVSASWRQTSVLDEHLYHKVNRAVLPYCTILWMNKAFLMVSFRIRKLSIILPIFPKISVQVIFGYFLKFLINLLKFFNFSFYFRQFIIFWTLWTIRWWNQ